MPKIFSTTVVVPLARDVVACFSKLTCQSESSVALPSTVLVACSNYMTLGSCPIWVGRYPIPSCTAFNFQLKRHTQLHEVLGLTDPEAEPVSVRSLALFYRLLP